nr:hypothetical protein [Microbacterium lemovicicum]
MKRIDLRYGGEQYSVGGRDLAEFQSDIIARLSPGAPPFWLEVNQGEGDPRPTFLLITPSTELAVMPVPGA